ncbi:MAG: class I SAM-dependent methyltransferase [Aquabacterium sp.]|nr:class I SAM-dependent methyltransferase [Aquabacterium sp.]
MSKTIDRDHIVWAYRLLLGREPESPAAVDQHLGETLHGLRDSFLRSDEYLAQANRRGPAPRAPAHGVIIEQLQTPETLALLLDHVGAEWSRLGETEPHWSVLTADKYSSGQIAVHLADFQRSGAKDVRHLDTVLRRNHLAWPSQGLCIDYGCGVGRMTLPLATHCAQVLGVDISAGHLHVAAQESAAQGLGNRLQWLQLRRLADLDSLPQADMVYSAIVLQHNPPPVMALTLDRLLRCLKPGGVGVFQLPTHIPGYRFVVAEYLQALRDGQHQGMEMHMLPQARVFEIIDAAGCQPCEVFSDEAAGPVYTSHTFVVRARR